MFEYDAPAEAHTSPVGSDAAAAGNGRQTAHKVLIVEDDLELAMQIGAYLSENCYATRIAHSARAADQALIHTRFDLAVIDVGLPGENGLSLCQRISRPRRPAIIMISAAGDEMDRVLGLELGADDYLAKPFGPRELLARVKAVLRRCAAPSEETSDVVKPHQISRYTLDPAQRRLYAPNGERLTLTRGEVMLLMILATATRGVVSRADLAQNGGASELTQRSLDAQVCRLRQKLADFGVQDMIVTQRGEGYALNWQAGLA